MVAFDGSEVSARALSLAKLHASSFKGATVVITTSLHGNIKEQLKSLETVERDLDRVKTAFDDDHIACITEVLSQEASAGESLVDFAKKNKIDEIIIGIRKTSKVGKFIFGSTAQYVILNSDCPVVTVH